MSEFMLAREEADSSDTTAVQPDGSASVRMQVKDATLTKGQTLKLFLELATNDSFRLRYEQEPATALIELGIPHSTIVNVKEDCLRPSKLASKEAFKEAHELLSKETTETRSQMIVPTLRLDQGRR